ncbi:hypothetical protein ENHAE0001_2193 [Enhydrobacter aerosaccus SK60]|nr:hypothetical protein ENHAE0001_2193 [Enhydrobacter aerosaccus SK60]
MAQVTHFNQVIRIDSEADNSVSIEGNHANGQIYITWGEGDHWAGFNFQADVQLHSEPGEYWGGYLAHAPTSEIEDVSNIIIEFDDSNTTLYTYPVDEIKELVYQMIMAEEVEAPNWFKHYASPV